MGLLGYLETLVNNAEIKIQQLEQQLQIQQQRIAQLEEELQNNTVKEVVELEDK
tara:strand:+ start:2325 stop:2486 length:162 start_codon:yes stop_codon:yes gene_type:complete